MKQLFSLLLFSLFSQMALAQQKTDSLAPVSWPDTITRFNEGILSDPLQLILGIEPGVEVFKAGSDPNVASSFMLRGANDQIGETYPLYVIDGIVGASLFTIPPQEIESVKILKNLSETSFYGTEGTGGVLLITTKKGNKNKKLSVSFNSAVSLAQTKGLEGLLTAQEMRDQASTHTSFNFIDGGATTDWQDELFRTTVSQSYQLSVGGTLKNTSYRLSFNHLDQPGNIRGSDRNMTGGSLNLSQTAFKNKLQVNGLVSYYQTNQNSVTYTSGRNSQNLLYQVFIQNPTDPVYTSGGSYYQSRRAFGVSNPAALADLITNEAKTKQLSAVLNANWDIWKGLGVKITGSYSKNESNGLYIIPPDAYPGAYTLNSESSYTYDRTNLLAGVTYNRSLGQKHNLDLFAGYMYRNSADDNEVNTNHDSSFLTYSLSTKKYTDYAILARLNYNFRQKYYLGVVLNQEHDESHITKEMNQTTLDWAQWSFYPGVAASWEISREGFMKNIKPVSTLILKGSYGITGARPGAEYISFYNPAYTDLDLKAETTTEFTAGIDVGFFRNRIMLEAEYYHRTTGNIIIMQPIPMPPNPVPYAYKNGMEVTNSGIELKLSTRVIDTKTVVWNSILGFSRNINEVVSIEGDISLNSGYIDYNPFATFDTYLFTTTTGHPVRAYNLPVFDRYYNGMPVYERENGGYTYNLSEARREIIDQVFPSYNLSWANSFSILKSIDLSLMFRYVAGHSIFNATRMYQSNPSNYLSLNTLQEAGTNYDNGVQQVPFSDMYLENASYLRLENLSAGYTFHFLPQNKKWNGRLRIYLAMNNLFTITGYSGLDPSFNNNSQGLDYFNTYPKSRTYTLGINLDI